MGRRGCGWDKGSHTRENHRTKRTISTQTRDESASLGNLSKAKDHAIAYDEGPDQANYTSLWFDRLDHDRSRIGRNYSDTQAALLLEQLQSKCFDVIRETAAFKTIVDDLEGQGSPDAE